MVHSLAVPPTFYTEGRGSGFTLIAFCTPKKRGTEGLTAAIPHRYYFPTAHAKYMNPIQIECQKYSPFRHAKGRKNKARLNPKLKAREFGLLKGQIKLAPDFDEPLEDFK